MRLFTLIPFLAWALPLPVSAQLGRGNDMEFRPRFDSTNDRAGSGRCRIRVRIDDEAEVLMQGDRVVVRVISGGPARDVGSECTSPLPRNLREFEFEKTDGRGRVDLVESPERNGRFIARIRDSKGGDDKYTLDFRWSGGGGFGSGGGFGGRDRDRGPFTPGGRDRDRDRDRGSQAARLCQDAVRGRLATDYGESDADIRLNSLDDNLGSRDVLEGEARARNSRDRYAFRCRVNLDTGRLRDVEVRRR